jgi:hypothetical protein
MPALIDRYRELGWRPALLLAGIACLIPVAFVLVVPHPLEQPIGVDYQLYREATRRWLDGGSFFEAYQLAGSYDIRAGDILYPPVAIWLFGPFSVVGAQPWQWLAALAWWAIPLALTGWTLRRLRPRPWTWPLLALCLSNPTFILKVWTGNPVIWSMAALALAAAGSSRATAPFVLLKPSLAPFALFGIRRRSWWVGAAILAALSLPFGSLWLDWLTALGNSRGGGLLYSSLEAPFLLLPLVAWLGRTRAGGGVSGGPPPPR